MKIMIWVAFLVLAGLWTGLVALTVQVTDWLLAAVASGQASDLASAAGQWPVPAWLALWVDTAWLQDLQAAWVGVVQWLGQVLPSAGGLMGWITPLLWTGWALVMLLLLVCAVAGHWLAGRLGATATRHLQRV
jgi:hypothetical protein